MFYWLRIYYIIELSIYVVAVFHKIVPVLDCELVVRIIFKAFERSCLSLVPIDLPSGANSIITKLMHSWLQLIKSLK